MTLDDTIAAIATPPGTGGLGIVRVSGVKSESIVRKLFRPSGRAVNFESHRLYHGDIIELDSGTLIDEVLLVLMKKPSSFTGEDALEIYCHGSRLILQAVLNEVIKSGCRPALPGEFTKRAFLNNRIDLSQAESICDMIMAKTDLGRMAALAHLKGKLSEKIESLRERIISILSLLESDIDFPEDEMSGGAAGVSDEFIAALSVIIEEIEILLATYEQGKILRDGADILIAGRPNVGKSSLLNALVGEIRAIVTPVPGTTRDYIEEFINIQGVPIKLTDTAGIRTPENIIEQEGIALVKHKLTSADLIIVLLDGSEPITDEDFNIMRDCKERNIIIAVNKIDLSMRIDVRELEILFPDTPILQISAKSGEGLPRLREALYKAAIGGNGDVSSSLIIANIRHKIALETAARHLSQTMEGALNNLSPELLAIDIRDALSSLAEITRKTTNEDVLNEIFGRFCIGK